MEMTLGQIAALLGAAVEGDAAISISGVAGVRDAGPGEVSYVALPKYAAGASETKAAALLVYKDFDKTVPCALIRVDNPEAAFTKVAATFAGPAPVYPPGIHAAAVVDPSAVVGRDVHIGAYAVIEAGAVIGDGSIIMAHACVGQGVKIGAACRLYPLVSVREYCEIGDRVFIHNGSVIGSDGFGYQVDKQGVRTKIPQIGIVVIGDDVEIGANCTIDRARFGKTRIGKGVKIDNLVQIGHNVIIGDHAVLVSQVGIAGSCIIGKHAILAGQVGVAGHLVIGDRAMVGAQGGVTKDVPPGVFVSGYPAAPHKQAAELHAHLNRLPQLKERVAQMEKRLQALEARIV